MSIAIEPEIETRLPERYEVINGEVVEAPPMSWTFLGGCQSHPRRTRAYARASATGRCRNDMLFHVPLPNDPTRNRRPDIAFISYDRWPSDRPLSYRGNPIDVVPDLIVEVTSPTDEAEDLLTKAFQYLASGVRLVWLVYPALRVTYAYESRDALRVFKIGDELDGGTVLPGFRVAMAKLFPEVTDFHVPSDE